MNYKPYKPIPPFKGMVLQNFPFIEEDFDAITNYQLLCKVIEYLKLVIDNEKIVEENVTNLYNSFVELKNYVDNYFANLDVQEEINNKLDEMVENGTLQEIIGEYLNANALWCFNTVEDMKNATNLINGSYAKTLGYYEVNDGGACLYYIDENEIENAYNIELSNNLYAHIQNTNALNIKQFGAVGDGVADDTNAIQKAIDYAFDNKLKLLIPSTNVFYKTTLPLQLHVGRGVNGYWGGDGSYLYGDNKTKSRIVKIGNYTDNQATDSTLVCRNNVVSNQTGTGITLENLSIEHYDNDNLEKTYGYAIYNYISRSTFKNLNINSFRGIYCECFSSLFENIVFNCRENALYLVNGTSNLFRFMYAPNCLNPYHIQSQYSTLLNVCCDNAKGTLFELGGMGLSLISCGSESKNAQYIFKIISNFTTLSIKDYYLIRQVGDSENNLDIEDCSILHAEQRGVVEIDNISIMENESIAEGNSYFFSLNTANLNLATDVKNIRYYKNFTGTDNVKINMWKNQPALKCMQRLSTQTHSFNYFVNGNLKLVPFIGGYKANTLSNEQGNCINSDDYSSSKTVWLDTKTKYTTEDGSDIRYTSSHNVGDLQLYNDPLLMNCLGLSITNVINSYTWDTLEIPIVLRGTTENRPTTNLFVGLQYFDTTLNKPIWYKGNGWVDSTGTSV